MFSHSLALLLPLKIGCYWVKTIWLQPSCNSIATILFVKGNRESLKFPTRISCVSISQSPIFQFIGRKSAYLAMCQKGERMSSIFPLIWIWRSCNFWRAQEKLELKCNFFVLHSRLNFFVTPPRNTVKCRCKKCKSESSFCKKAPNIMGHEIPSTPLQFFFQDHNFPLFGFFSRVSNDSMEWQELQNVYICFCSFAVAPQIRPVPQSGRLVVHQGEAATLGCDILKGTPTPEITWKRKVRKLFLKVQHNRVWPQCNCCVTHTVFNFRFLPLFQIDVE